jgi:hypothetical protein
MKRSSLPVQCDLFGSVPARPTLTILQRHHDELVELLSRLIWEVEQGVDYKMTRESAHEQDHR